jgi:hypothetical protein
VARHEDDVFRARQALGGRAIQQIAGDALYAARFQFFLQPFFGEARDADDALARRSALRHARERRAHLAADAEHHEVALGACEIRLELARRPRHEFFERRYIREVNHPVKL